MIPSITAWGAALPLNQALQRILDNCGARRTVELSIGARPVSNPEAVLASFDFQYIGHHALPLGVDAMVRPSPGNQWVVADTVRKFSLHSYSAHPPANVLDWMHFWRWAMDYREELADVPFGVEVMYVPQVAGERRCFLATPAEVWKFLTAADRIGWEKPLVIDLSHLHIGDNWDYGNVRALMEADVAMEYHVSSNDGRRDQHRPLDPNSIEASWAAMIPNGALVVDEGKRRL